MAKLFLIKGEITEHQQASLLIYFLKSTCEKVTFYPNFIFNLSSSLPTRHLINILRLFRRLLIFLSCKLNCLSNDFIADSKWPMKYMNKNEGKHFMLK